MADTIIRVENLGKLYRIGQLERYKTLRDTITNAVLAPFRSTSRDRSNPRQSTKNLRSDRYVWALRNISFEIKEGQVVGIIGRNAAGKSTLLKILSRITEPTEGWAEINGRVGSLLEVGTGFHLELTGKENIYLNGAVLGLKRIEIDEKFDEIVDFAEVGKFIDTPVKRYSSGMQVRLAFAVAAYLEPEILLVDEVLAVGDAAFQKKCLGRMEDVAREGRTVLFVSHNMAAVQNLCEIGYLLDEGRLIASGDVGEVVGRYTDTISSSENPPLSGRKDRRGNGKLVFVDFSVRGGTSTADTVMCGSGASFVIRYEGTPPLRNVRMSLGIYTLTGQRTLYLSNELAGQSFDELQPSGAFVCHFEKLPLMPGTYAINLHCVVNGLLADWVTDAIRLHVTEGDYFGTGKLPPQGYGAVVVPHRWTVEEV